MADKTAQEIIDEEKRKLQTHAIPRMDPDLDVGQEIFLKEMKEAEAKGDLPPGQVYGGRDVEVVRSKEGGETPTEAAKTYEEEEDRLIDESYALGDRLERVMAKIAPDKDATGRQSELSGMMELIAEGKVTINDPELQQEAFEVATALKKAYRTKDNPEGYVPSHGYGRTNISEDLSREGEPVREAVSKGELK